MVIPISATPTLKGKEALDFIATIKANENKPVGLIPTPKLEKARKLIESYAKSRGVK